MEIPGYDPSRWPTDPKLLRYEYARTVAVPESVRVCPECGGPLHLTANSWDDITHEPIAFELQVECVADALLFERAEEEDWDAGRLNAVAHRWWQSDWQDVIDDVRKWAGAIE